MIWLPTVSKSKEQTKDSISLRKMKHSGLTENECWQKIGSHWEKWIINYSQNLKELNENLENIADSF